MGRHGFPPITPLSAAFTIVQWKQEHARPPQCKDCVGSGGLYWWNTYYKTFVCSTWSAVLSIAFDLISGQAVLQRSMKRCLNYPECQEWLPHENHSIRICQRCKRAKQHHPTTELDATMLEPAFTRPQLKRWGVGMADWGWENLMEWDE